MNKGRNQVGMITSLIFYLAHVIKSVDNLLNNLEQCCGFGKIYPGSLLILTKDILQDILEFTLLKTGIE